MNSLLTEGMNRYVQRLELCAGYNLTGNILDFFFRYLFVIFSETNQLKNYSETFEITSKFSEACCLNLLILGSFMSTLQNFFGP